jgi:hypothetical protein
MQHLKADITIIGGSTGGVAAAIAALRMGCNVIMVEETDWIGGQLTSQGVPPDEHQYIEKTGCTKSYREFREKVRVYYRNNFPLNKQTEDIAYLNPGNAAVGRLSIDPRVAVAVLEEMLMPYIFSGQLQLLKNSRLMKADVNGDTIESVFVENHLSGEVHCLRADYFLDGTDCGDLLPLCKAEYVMGSESQIDTDEPHALSGQANPYDMQAVSHCFAVDYIAGEDFTIEKPETYEYWKKCKVDYWPDRQLSMTTPHHITHEPLKWSLFGGDGGRNMFQYRRVLDKTLFLPETYHSDITIINVPQTDYFEGVIFDVPDAAWHLKAAKELSLSFLYWLQTEAPTRAGTLGYKGLRLRKDVMGTEDGLAKAIYVRESRRIKAEFTILEQYVATDSRKYENKAVQFEDSVGIGLYRIDLHPSTGGRNYIDIDCLPFQIPLGAFIPVRMENMLPACKNIGTTHITNGCYRLHPVEWNIGEAAGALAAYCIKNKYKPREVYHMSAKRIDFQMNLKKLGIELVWKL